ncbi:HPr family phosphocarrier protein [Alkaliphilus serpentinus]|uniref:Phosphocarrier protein HPr n=1 Tax=Alkaliphilus serpentinus TaxID=1482731 RepID=A0A833HLR1_9FIRM|nr:HPr family phosphocarrier protein [Alkaliphilus serpentinus]KAB3524831.1 HPr family phosphocarrier protein [Alkaliphilus serpentinus]
MLEKKVIVKNEIGLHARPASLLVKAATSYKSDVYIIKDGNEYNGKSIMNILSLGAQKGDELLLKIDGPDEEQAIEALVRLIEVELKEKY